MQCIRFLSRLSYIGVFSRFVDMPSRPRLALSRTAARQRASVLARLERASAPRTPQRARAPRGTPERPLFPLLLR